MGKIDNLFEASRFILPEHKEGYLEWRRRENLIPQPIIEEDEYTEMCFQIQDSIQFDTAVTIHWWSATRVKMGVIESAWGWIDKIDTHSQQLKLKNDEEYWWIQLSKIISVRQT